MHRHFESTRIMELRRLHSFWKQNKSDLPKINKLIVRIADIAWNLCKIPSKIEYDQSCDESILELKKARRGIIISNHVHVFDVPIITDVLLENIWFQDDIYCITQRDLISPSFSKACWGIPVFKQDDLALLKEAGDRDGIRSALQENKRVFKSIIPELLSGDWNYLAIFPQWKRVENSDFTMPERNLRNIYVLWTPFLLVKLLYSDNSKKLQAEVRVVMEFLDPSNIASFEEFKESVGNFYM